MLDIEQYSELAEYLRGTSNTIREALGVLFDIEDIPDENSIEVELLDYDCERCSGCDWWFHSQELVDPNDFTGEHGNYCDSCRDNEFCED